MGHDTFDVNIKGSGYNIAVMIITGFMFGISISNCIYFSKIAEKPSQAMGKSAAKAMLGVNALLAALSGVIFIWSSYKLIVSNEDKYNTMKKYIDNTSKRFHKMRQQSKYDMEPDMEMMPMRRQAEYDVSDFSDWD